MNDRPSIYTSFHCDLFESVGVRSHYLHGMNRIWFYVKPGQEWPRKEAHRYAWRTYTWLFCVHMYVCLSACTCVCACMWYLGVCCWGPLRRSMLTRGAAGPPDVPIPARLVTRGPLLLSPYCTQICTHIQHFFIRLYIVHKQRTWMKSVSVQSDASSLWLKSRWCICLSIPKVETTLNIHVSHALVNCFCDAEDKAHHLWQSVQFPNPGGLFYFLHMAVWSHSRLDESWSGTFHGAMTLGGGCNHLEMSWERSTPTSQPSSTGWLMRF